MFEYETGMYRVFSVHTARTVRLLLCGLSLFSSPLARARAMLREFDMDTLLQRMSLGFCIGHCGGQIYTSNRLFNDFFRDHHLLFMLWWKSMFSEIHAREDKNFTDVVFLEKQLDLPGDEPLKLQIWIFFMGPDQSIACLFFKEINNEESRETSVSPSSHFAGKKGALTDSALHFNDSIMHALRKKEFSILYQPIMDVRSGEIAGFEALLQWRHLTHKEIVSAQFLDLLESTGVSLPLGIWFVNNVCRQVRTWNSPGERKKNYFVQLNMSPQQLDSTSMLHALQHALDSYGIDPDLLWIESPKSSFENHIGEKNMLLQRYHALGVNLVVNDLQTNLADLGYFFRFSIIPFKAVKMMEFSSCLGGKGHQFELFKTFAKIFSFLGILVLVKGTAGPKELIALRQTQCRYAQKDDLSTLMDGVEVQKMLHVQENRNFCDISVPVSLLNR